MNSICKQDIITLFENYRYNFLKEKDGALIFEYASGMYSGVEIVPVDDQLDKSVIEDIREGYSKSGYATHVYEQCDINRIQKDLFNGFFQTKLSNAKIKNKYKKYCERVMLQYGKCAEDYQYIEVPFEKEVDFYEVKTTDNLVDSIYSTMQGEGAKLVIIEAPAGFGKTSTAYELLSRYQEVSVDVRPFMMELYKDRTASIFKYILLSNIDADFDVTIKSEIVIDNIKAGRIPLIVDGFDELLSKDVDRGGYNIEFEEVESMLSTIADLLQDNAKIILTSRKTAIFSSEEFVVWYDKLIEKGLDFQIIKYSLNCPTIKDWITQDEISKYDENILKALNNPVLLGFIKYCGKDLDGVRTEIVDKFFNLLLTREIERQGLPFSVEEQKIIMRRLAMVLAGFNCSTDTRSSITSTISETSSKLIANKVSASRDLDEILNSLTNHALLNRKNDKIGFLNDFIYGYMLSESFLHYFKEDDYVLDFAPNIQQDFLNKCINTAVFLPDTIRVNIWKSMKAHASFSKEEAVLCDWKLCGLTVAPVSDLSFDDERLVDCVFGKQGVEINNCTFSNIYFISCTFDFNYLSGCTFVRCAFEDCVREGNNYHCYAYGCLDPGDILKRDDTTEDATTISDDLSDEEVKISILKKYFMVGNHRRRMKLISAIRKDYVDNERQFKRCLDALASNKLLIVNGDKSFITDDGIQWLQSK
ncbi:MAG: hypothetical protein J5644_00250 [Bacteroidales bacterium]|nr:hypothetical protein [Bacteroidales bacterium]